MSIVFKDKTEEKYEDKFFKGFCFKTHKQAFLESTNFFSALALKTIDPQMLFWSIFLKCTKKRKIKENKNIVFNRKVKK